jgi:LAT3 family solute carrier family 43 protein 3
MALTAGSTLIATAEVDGEAALAACMFFLGMGSGAYLCVQPITALFQEAASTAMATLSGANQISGTLFLVGTTK